MLKCVEFIVRLKLPGPDGRGNRWHESAVAAANHAEKKWGRVTANMLAGMYDLFEASGDLAELVWPELIFRDLLNWRFVIDVSIPSITQF